MWVTYECSSSNFGRTLHLASHQHPKLTMVVDHLLEHAPVHTNNHTQSWPITARAGTVSIHGSADPAHSLVQVLASSMLRCGCLTCCCPAQHGHGSTTCEMCVLRTSWQHQRPHPIVLPASAAISRPQLSHLVSACVNADGPEIDPTISLPF